MNSATQELPSPILPSIFEHFPRVATQARHAITARRLAFWSSLVAAPVGAGLLFGRRHPLRGLLAGSVAALALGALRVQLARWFTEEPDYVREGEVGELQLRRYPARIEAMTEVDATDFEDALDLGYNRLACYIDGANQGRAVIPMAAPVVTSMHDGRYAMTFVMPPGKTLGELPKPDDVRVEVHEGEARRIAAMRFHGRFTRENIARHEKKLLKQLVDAGLSARGSVMFAAYDSPATLPQLRRNELWIEIV